MPEKIDRDRRQLLGNAAATIAAAQFGTTALASERAGKMKMVRLPTLKPGTDTSFASLKQVDAGSLNVGYAEAGPVEGPQSFCCMAGPTIFTAMSMSRQSWHRR